ncbi:MAG: cation diffusion facilitator family transporter [Candidatus Binatia bacterium]|nr:cation diffusion facilitator family transporter [Candidatus Binatia bacterium]
MSSNGHLGGAAVDKNWTVAPHPTKPSSAALSRALVLTASFCAVEAAAGWWVNSLALLSDAGHMLSDVAALAIALLASWVARRPPTESKTFGYHRIEIVAAFVNGLAMWLVVGLIWHEAYRRLWSPPAVLAAGMIPVAALGLAVNAAVLWMLHRGPVGNLNVRAAIVHVFGDALGSLSALAAGLAMWAFGWQWADAVAGLCIGALILYSSWEIVRESLDILMMGTPRELSLGEIERTLLDFPGVLEVHDLHVWTMTSGMYELTAHLVVRNDVTHRALIEHVQTVLRDRFGITHMTLQLDPEDACAEEFRRHARTAG